MIRVETVNCTKHSEDTIIPSPNVKLAQRSWSSDKETGDECKVVSDPSPDDRSVEETRVCAAKSVVRLAALPGQSAVCSRESQFIPLRTGRPRCLVDKHVLKVLSMAILGIQSLIYGVEDVAECTRFFTDFGLPLVSSDPEEARFQLDEGSEVRILSMTDKRLPESVLVGPGVREVVLGVDTAEALASLVKDLGRDRDVVSDADGVAHFLSDCGLPLALTVFRKKTVVNAPDPLNAPGVVQRLNTHRKWRTRARPKSIQHVVFAVKDFRASFAFFRDRMNFRLSDYQHGFGIYSRAEGSNSHHNLFLLSAALPFPGMDGQPRFHHANFGVEDVDEMMVGANFMERKGWPKSHLGLGRHRIDSALFLYLPSPAGGEAEYGADADFIDDNWVPREWPVPLFAFAHFVHNLPVWLLDPPAWEIGYLVSGEIPEDKGSH